MPKSLKWSDRISSQNQYHKHIHNIEIENQTSEENKGDVVWAALPQLNIKEKKIQKFQNGDNKKFR